jgi:glyoxylase-like metal-dependent hydrolase (beta-lactamase superfamily II)
MTWNEVADGVFQRRYDPLDISVCVVRGTHGLLLVDTRSSHREADEIRADLRVFGDVPVRWVVNTHGHYDHCWGNARFGRGSGIEAQIYGHRRMPAHLVAFERPRLENWIARGVEPLAEWREVVITPPDVLVDDHAALDVGDRFVDLLHLGRGHTDNDVVVHVPDADAWLVGDLIEESGPPMYGSNSCPLEWPATVAALARRIGPGATVVPGHGAPVERSFVVQQQTDLKQVADLIAELHAAGVPAGEAVAQGRDRWPFPEDGMVSAVADAYPQLDGPTHGIMPAQK